MALSSPRFFVPRPLECGAILKLPEETIRHIRALRLNEGNKLTLFNGQGGEYQATLQTMTHKEALVSIENHLPREAEALYPITLAQGVAENHKMEWLIEKTVELGISEIMPLLSARSVVRLDEARATKRQMRWMQIVQAASEQCGRNRLAHVYKPLSADQWLSQLPPIAHNASHPHQNDEQTIRHCPTQLLFSPNASQGLSDLKHYPSPPIGTPITILIGPEGGLTPAEENTAITRGFTAFHLGPRILRTETAGIVAIASLGMCWPK